MVVASWSSQNCLLSDLSLFQSCPGIPCLSHHAPVTGTVCSSWHSTSNGYAFASSAVLPTATVGLGCLSPQPVSSVRAEGMSKLPLHPIAKNSSWPWEGA